MSLSRLSGVSSSSGVVRSKEDYNVIPAVTIELLSELGQPTGTYYKTDDNGSFVIPTYGVYGMRLSHAEFAPFDVAAGSVTQDMAIYMERKDGMLPPVTITAGKKTNVLVWLAIAGAVYYAFNKKLF